MVKSGEKTVPTPSPLSPRERQLLSALLSAAGVEAPKRTIEHPSFPADRLRIPPALVAPSPESPAVPEGEPAAAASVEGIAPLPSVLSAGLGFVALPAAYFVFLAAATVVYLSLVEWTKRRVMKDYAA